MPTRCGETETGTCTWTDWLDDASVDTRVARPTTEAEVIALVEAAVRDGTPLRAGGASHSTSLVSHPPSDGALVLLDRMTLGGDDARWRRTDLDRTTPRLAAPGEDFVRVPAGWSIRKLNDELARPPREKALVNLGSYDWQSVAGAISTATHGSGLASGAMCDLVASIELVTYDAGVTPARVRHLRVEPRNGITDPARFRAASDRGRLELVQDDDLFYSVVVGCGSLGIVTAVTLHVVPRFWLREKAELVPWRTLKEGLLDRVQAEPYFDFVLCTQRHEGEHVALVTTRQKLPAPPYKPRRDLPQRSDARQRAAHDQTREGTPHAALAAVYASPLGIPTRCLHDYFAEDDATTRRDGHLVESESFIVFRTSVGDRVAATSAELALPIGLAVPAVNAVLQRVDTHLTPAGYYHVSPIGVRFSLGSPHHLAMQHGRATVTIEMPLMKGTVGRYWDPTSSSQDAAYQKTRDLILTGHERTLRGLGGRPHWGQRHTVQWGWVLGAYPKAGVWHAKAYRRFNARGTFTGPWTRSLGIPA